MAYEHKEGMGALFTNNYKDKDTQPDLKGNIMIGGEIVKLSGWKKTTSQGKDFISLSVDTFEAKADVGYRQDIPF